jgi:hypothetical protein
LTPKEDEVVTCLLGLLVGFLLIAAAVYTGVELYNRLFN